MQAQHHDDVTVFQALFHVVEGFHAEPANLGRKQSGRGHHPYPRPHDGEQADVRAGDAGMHDIAADGYAEAGEFSLAAADGECVEKGLGGMFVAAVAAVDDGAVDLFREQLDRARVGMAHHQHVRMHGVQRHGGVDQGLALLDRAGGDRHVDDVGTEPFSRQLEGGAGTGGIFEKEVDTGAPAQGGALFIGLAILFNVGFGKVKELGNLVRRKPLNAEKMSVRKANLRRSSGH